ncbi:hypothetical protein UPYG_G00234010 [Umbra pygmaea]|uniref:Uncharacterized protein n=1 Tax=Umbra pygmaea TaxID=75934 RepID=A0ABD0WJ03_UMBPY
METAGAYRLSDAVEDHKQVLTQHHRQLSDLSTAMKEPKEPSLVRGRHEDATLQLPRNPRFASYTHLMAFWKQIEPANRKIIRVTRAQCVAKTDEVPHTGNATGLQPIDKFFLFMNYFRHWV